MLCPMLPDTTVSLHAFLEFVRSETYEFLLGILIGMQQ
jgi:hypothetical protein